MQWYEKAQNANAGWNIVLRIFMKCLKFCWCKTFDWQIARLDQMSSTMVSYLILCFQPHDEDFEESMFTMKFDGNIPSWVFFENHFKISSHLIQTKHIRRLRVFLDSWHLWHCHLQMSIHSVVWPNSFGIVVVVINEQAWELFTERFTKKRLFLHFAVSACKKSNALLWSQFQCYRTST